MIPVKQVTVETRTGTVTLALGQTWVEVDPRFKERLVTIVDLDEGSDDVRIKNMQSGRESTAKRVRFHGKRGGYRLVEQA